MYELFICLLLQYFPSLRSKAVDKDECHIVPPKVRWHVCRPDYIPVDTLVSLIGEIAGDLRQVSLDEYTIDGADLSLVFVENPSHCTGDMNLVIARNPGRGMWCDQDSITLWTKVSQHEYDSNNSVVKENLRCSIRALAVSYYSKNDLSIGWIKW